MDLTKTVALVTGANRGLGLAFTQALLAAGVRKVYAAARDPASVKLPGVTPIRLDVTDAARFAEVAREAGDVNLLINNAGIERGASLLSPEGEAALRDELDTNFFGILNGARAFAPVLAANGGGAIVNVLSVLSWVNLPKHSTYSVTKAAAWGLSNGLRNELRGQQTRVVALHVGYMDTDMVRDQQADKADPNDVARQVLQALAEGRDEVLADGVARHVKSGLSAEPGIYLGGA